VKTRDSRKGGSTVKRCHRKYYFFSQAKARKIQRFFVFFIGVRISTGLFGKFPQQSRPTKHRNAWFFAQPRGASVPQAIAR